MDECTRLGLETGLFASSSWNAGGSWITPPDSGKELRWSEVKVSGPAEFSAILPMSEKARDPYEEVAVLAVPQADGKTLAEPSAAIRLDDRLAADGRLTWSVPAGEWSILRFVANRSGEHLKIPSPNSNGLLVDRLSSQATDAHFNHILDTIGKGRDGFGPFKLLMLDSYEVEHTVDWTNGFQQEFQKRNGYDPAPWLPVLAGWKVGDGELGARFRHDYQKLVSDLMIENHFAHGREILNKRGLQLLAEAGHGGHPRVDPLKALGASDIPMGEFWNQNKNWVTKEASSAANIYGLPLVNAETLTGWRNWQDGPAGYKRLYDLAFCAGLNQASFHTFAHNPPEAGKPGFAYHAGEHFNVNSTWWPYAKPMIENMSRSCHMLQQGRFVADVCVYYGDEAPNLVPARRIPPGVEIRWPDEMCPHCGMKKPANLDSLGRGYDYDYINTPADDSTAIKILSHEQDRVTAKVWRPGKWRVESARGGSGEIAVSKVTPDQPIGGPWQVKFHENLGAPSDIVMETLSDWTAHENPGVRYFSGTARYQTNFTLTSLPENGNPVILYLGDVKEVAEVTVNGRNLGIAWKQPNRIVITAAVRPGGNQLEIAVTNLWNNRIVGDLKNPDQAPVARTNMKGKFNANSPLLPSGLIAPVSLRFPVTATTEIER